MKIQFYNTLSHQLETFTPQAPPKVTMYNCGPTVYDYAHIGNFRAFVFADVIRRFLELAGFDVLQVMNLTDVGHMTDDQLADGGGQDKMVTASSRIKEAKKAGKLPADAVPNPDDPYQIADYYIRAFLEDGQALGLKIVNDYPQFMPRATQYIPQMQAMIAKLLESGHAYVAEDGAVYYSVQSFPSYGALSGNSLDNLRGGGGGRVLAQHQVRKRHPADFLLWKPDPAHIMKWNSPWGEGYPGWHIECSAMATAVTGREVIDIHTGGEDNIFPHHECEIAQSCGASGRDTFARYWLHTRFLMVEGEKMSKSRGNFYTVRDLLAKGADPAAIRFELLKGHYRSNANFTFKGLEDSLSAVRRLRQAAQQFAAHPQQTKGQPDHPLLQEFTAALADDLNTAGAIGAVFKWLANPTGNPSEAFWALYQVDSVLGVLVAGENAATGPADDEFARQKAQEIDQARARKDFAAADALRQELTAAGYEVKTTKDGTSARKKLA